MPPLPPGKHEGYRQNTEWRTSYHTESVHCALKAYGMDRNLWTVSQLDSNMKHDTVDKQQLFIANVTGFG